MGHKNLELAEFVTFAELLSPKSDLGLEHKMEGIKPLQCHHFGQNCCQKMVQLGHSSNFVPAVGMRLQSNIMQGFSAY